MQLLQIRNQKVSLVPSLHHSFVFFMLLLEQQRKRENPLFMSAPWILWCSVVRAKRFFATTLRRMEQCRRCDFSPALHLSGFSLNRQHGEDLGTIGNVHEELILGTKDRGRANNGGICIVFLDCQLTQCFCSGPFGGRVDVCND